MRAGISILTIYYVYNQCVGMPVAYTCNICMLIIKLSTENNEAEKGHICVALLDHTDRCCRAEIPLQSTFLKSSNYTLLNFNQLYDILN